MKNTASTAAFLLKNLGLTKEIFGTDASMYVGDGWDSVKTMGEFLWLLSHNLVDSVPDFYRINLKGEINTYKELKALEHAFENATTDPVLARTVAHNMYSYYPNSLQSGVIPDGIKTAAQDLLSGKYPASFKELAVNGSELQELGYQGKEIGEALRMVLQRIYGDNVRNDKEELLNILKKNNNVLNEERTEKVEYGVLMLYFNLPKWNKLIDLIDGDDVYEVDGEFGLETKPHVTILYGFHDEITSKKVFDLYKENFDLKPIKVSVDEISIFESDEFDVVKFDVGSEILTKMNSVMRELPSTITFPKYHAHITIAYVKKGSGKKYVNNLNKKFSLTGNKLVFSTKKEKEDTLELNENGVLNEGKKKEISKYREAKNALMRSKSLPKEMKEKILKYFGGGSSYIEGGRVRGLTIPKVKGKSFNGVSLGADKKGFYVYTHRAASKRHESPDKIPQKEINFIESTG